jgi:hypothetical protein
LQAVLGNSTANLRTVPQGSDRPDARIPREWYTEGGAQRIGKAVEYHGRQFRPMRGGVRILSGIELKDVVSPLKDLGPWSLHLSPFGSLGFGAGVFELDENLCPIRWLIRPRVAGETAEGGETVSLACSSKSIGLVVVSSKGAALQAYSREGVLQNEASLGPYPSGWAQQQLIPFESGFLFSDRQLVWIGAGADHRVWRFGPSLSRTSMDRSGDRWRYFGNPLVVQGCLYVTGLDGHLYVFDTAQITRGDK